VDLAGTRLVAKIRGGLLGAAVGDALGGPVEGLHYLEIERRHGRVAGLLPYGQPPAEHNQWTNAPGSITDDTRMALLVAQALIDSEGTPSRGDLTKVFADYFYGHDEGLARSFIEEYVMKGFYGSRKLAYGGQPTNGALMGNGPIGLVNAADPRAAFSRAFELAYITDGYAKESAAMGAAAVAAAMVPGAAVDDVVASAVDAADWFRRDGPRWSGTIEQFEWARFEGRPNERLVESAVAIAARVRDVAAIRAPLYELLHVSPVGSEAGQTLAVALAMLTAADGDFTQSVLGAVNYGRDCDSYAAVTGAIAGAMHGVDAVPEALRAQVIEANPDDDLEGTAMRLAGVAEGLHAYRRSVTRDVEELLIRETPHSDRERS
jgi:ADP-ribosylglycohydrolase